MAGQHVCGLLMQVRLLLSSGRSTTASLWPSGCMFVPRGKTLFAYTQFGCTLLVILLCLQM